MPQRPACASWRMAKILSRARHDGLPTPPPSVASGNDRQIRRMRSSIASPPASARRRLGAIVRRYAPDSVDRLRPLAAPFGRLERVREVVGLLRDLARIIGLQDRDEADRRAIPVVDRRFGDPGRAWGNQTAQGHFRLRASRGLVVLVDGEDVLASADALTGLWPFLDDVLRCQ